MLAKSPASVETISGLVKIDLTMLPTLVLLPVLAAYERSATAMALEIGTQMPVRSATKASAS